MTDKKQRFVLLFLLTLFLGGCSLFTDKAAERNDSDCRKHENGASDKTLVNQYRS